MSLKSLHALVVHGKCVFLMSSCDWQEVRKCSSVPSWFYVQWEHRVHRLSSPRSVLLHGQAVFAESVSGQGFPQFWAGHGGQVFCSVVFFEGQKAASLLWFLVDSFQCAKHFTFSFLIIWFCLMCQLLCVGQSPRTSWIRGHLSGCNSVGKSRVVVCPIL